MEDTRRVRTILSVEPTPVSTIVTLDVVIGDREHHHASHLALDTDAEVRRIDGVIEGLEQCARQLRRRKGLGRR